MEAEAQQAPVTESPPAVGQTTAVTETPAEHKVFPPFDSTTFASQLLWLAITFVALYFLLSKVAMPRIAGILAERKGRIAGDIAKAEAAKARSEAALAGYEKALATARNNAFAIAEGARNASKAAADAERAGTEADLAKKLTAAEARIAEIKAKALSEVGAIAGEATSAIVKALIDADIPGGDIDAAVGRALGK